MIRFAIDLSAYDQFFNQGDLLTRKLMLQGFLKVSGNVSISQIVWIYNDVVGKYALPLAQTD
jgi:hypothetical protein